MRRISGWLVVGLLVGCSDAKIDELEVTLDEIRRSPGGQPPELVSPIPAQKRLEYHYADERSPFLAPEVVSSQTLQLGELAPDQQRPSEPLEEFQLQSLQLVGTLSMGSQHLALIASPDGRVTSVRVGNYMGSHYGRVTQITPQAITLVERVFSQQHGWQERQATLAIDK